MSYDNIIFSNEAGIARLTLNRPERLNSFNDAMHAEVRDALAKVRAEATVRVLLLTGAGRGFCAGQDLADRRRTGFRPVDIGASIERNYKPLVLTLRALPLPVVCASAVSPRVQAPTSRSPATSSSRPSPRASTFAKSGCYLMRAAFSHV
jgi:2-(1,2-epoxy-1,2-dihydrophenyl)acetyl-CoA isomerase